MIGDKIVAITKAPSHGAVLKSEMGSVNSYQFDEAFDEDATQDEIYQRTAKKLIPSVMEGFNVTVFAYGATGSGKTHTMMGSERMDAERATGAEGGGEKEGNPNKVCGIIPNTLVDIFEGLEVKREEAELPNEKWALEVSYLEVYNEKVRDLFEPSSINLPVQEDPKSGIVGVGRLSSKPARTATEVLHLLRKGNANRRTHATDARGGTGGMEGGKERKERKDRKERKFKEGRRSACCICLHSPQLTSRYASLDRVLFVLFDHRPPNLSPGRDKKRRCSSSEERGEKRKCNTHLEPIALI